MGIIEIIGLLGGICFAICGVPVAYQTYKAGRSVGTPMTIAWFILAGTALMYTYLLATYGFDWIIAFSYWTEFLSWALIVWYHYCPRR